MYSRERIRLPDAAQANEHGPRPQDSAFLVDLIKYLSLDEVCVATEGYDDRGVRWGSWLIWAVISAVSLDQLQLTRSGIENNIGRTVDNSGLKPELPWPKDSE